MTKKYFISLKTATNISIMNAKKNECKGIKTIIKFIRFPTIVLLLCSTE